MTYSGLKKGKRDGSLGEKAVVKHFVSSAD